MEGKDDSYKKAKNLNTLFLGDLIRPLMDYEDKILNDQVDGDKKKKNIAFKSLIIESDDEKGKDANEEMIALMVKSSRAF